MGIKMPQEIEVWYLLPAIRREFVKTMLGRGLSQREVAGKLGITESAVSQYLSSKRATDVKFNKRVIGEIGKSVDSILKGGSVIKEVNRICELCKKDRVLCDIHRSHGDIPKKCRVCLK